MNEPLNPHMPATGTQIFCVAIREGKLTVTQEGTVVDRERFQLTEEEFATSHGSRYNIALFWPGGAPSFWNPERWHTESMFLYTTEQGKLGALDRLKSDYVRACIKAEEDLQAKARLLHQYASDAQQIQL